MADSNAPDKSGGNASKCDRDERGRFLEGHAVGEEQRWTSETAPKSPGRPKSRRLTDALTKHLDSPASKIHFMERAAKKMGMDPTQMTCFEVLMASAMLHGVQGKSEILKQVWERIEGSVPKVMSLEMDDPVQLYINDMMSATQPPSPSEDVVEKGPADGSVRDLADDEDRDVRCED